MSRFDFYESEASKRLGRYAADLLLTELEKAHRNRSFGRITLEVDVARGELVQVVVTPQVRVKASDLAADDS